MKFVFLIGDITGAGGTERATINLVNMLIASNEVYIISTGKSGESFFPINSSVQIEFLNLSTIPNSNLSKIMWFANVMKGFRKKLREINPNVIIGQGHNICSFIPFIKNKNAKTVACEHIDFDSIPSNSKTIIRLLYPKLNAVIALSDIAAKKLARMNSNIVVIPNSLPFFTEKYSELKNEKILMVGRISKVKGYERIIPIAKKLIIDYPNWMINIFGDGEEKEYLLQLLAANKITNVKINSPKKNIKEEYLDSSALLITSYNEALPMVILEAQHCGLPVLGYRCEGTASLIENNVTGFIANNEDEFYSKLLKIIASHSLREKIGTAGKLRSMEYSDKNILKKWNNLFENL